LAEKATALEDDSGAVFCLRWLKNRGLLFHVEAIEAGGVVVKDGAGWYKAREKERLQFMPYAGILCGQNLPEQGTIAGF